MEASGHSAAAFFSYQESVHGKAVAAGSDKAAVCTDCHGSHEILNAADPKSSIYKFNVPNTCAKCHESVKTEFMAQHSRQSNIEGRIGSACVHRLPWHSRNKVARGPNSSVSAQNLARTTCAKCHEGVRLSEDFGVAGGRASTYMASYHGLALKMGSKYRPIVPVATVSTTFFRRPIRSRPSVRSTWQRRVGNAIRGQARTLSRARFTLKRHFRPT